MSEAFYTKMAATANRLITKRGRPVWLIKPSNTLDDTDKPWGPDDESDPVSTPQLYGVFVPPNTVREFGITSLGRGSDMQELVEKSAQIAIVNTGDIDPRGYQTLLDSDGDVKWGITAIQTLKPATIGLISFIGVER